MAENDLDAKERLLASAAQLFLRKGYSAASVREIVEDAGVTKPSLYYHFGNKEGIFHEIVKRAYESYSNAIEMGSVKSLSKMETIISILSNIFDLIVERLDIVKIMNAAYYAPEEGSPKFDYQIYHKKISDSLMKEIDDGINSGEFKSTNRETIFYSLMGCIHVAVDLQFAKHYCNIDRNRFQDMLRLVFNGILVGIGEHK